MPVALVQRKACWLPEAVWARPTTTEPSAERAQAALPGVAAAGTPSDQNVGWADAAPQHSTSAAALRTLAWMGKGIKDIPPQTG